LVTCWPPEGAEHSAGRWALPAAPALPGRQLVYTRAVRVAAAVVFVLASCGRLGFVDTGLVVEQTDTTATLTAPGRFKLVFDRRYEWQPVRWFDLASDPDRDLIDKAPIDASRNMIQGLLVRWADDWQIAGEGSDPTIGIERLDPDHVRLTTGWTWTTPTRQFAVSIVHTIAGDGQWTLDAKVSDPTGDTSPLQQMEYADAHLTPDLAWEVTTAGTSYEFVAMGVTPAPAIQVIRETSLGTLQSDELNNRYWAVGSVAMPLELTWTVTLGQR